MNKKYIHKPVLLKEVIKSLQINPSGIYIDATFGCGGHSLAILSKLNNNGKLIAIDRDIESVNIAKNIHDKRFSIIFGNFSYIEYYIKKKKLFGNINGVLLDLGISSLQLDNPNRGFSFIKDGPLDMRMNQMKGQTAENWLLNAKKENIKLVLQNFGQERFSKKISNEIIKKRHLISLNSTFKLVSLIKNVIPYIDKNKHFATRTFQAIRMYINNEIREIELALYGIINILSLGGILSVISFHSIEDRIIKNFINKYSKINILSKIPLTELEILNKYNTNKKLKLLGKIKPSKLEIKYNQRSRSAILRYAKKIL